MMWSVFGMFVACVGVVTIALCLTALSQLRQPVMAKLWLNNVSALSAGEVTIRIFIL
jgi:hypothetical protein